MGRGQRAIGEIRCGSQAGTVGIAEAISNVLRLVRSVEGSRFGG